MEPLTAPASPPAPPALQGPRRSSPIIEWKGKLPEPLARYLERVTPFDLPDAYVVLGRFLEVRELVNIARQVHEFLDRGPHTAASGRWSFQEFMTAKVELERQIRLLHHRVNRAAQDARLSFPPSPSPKEDPDAHVA
jgi:hypothetical protein